MFFFLCFALAFALLFVLVMVLFVLSFVLVMFLFCHVCLFFFFIFFFSHVFSTDSFDFTYIIGGLYFHIYHELNLHAMLKCHLEEQNSRDESTGRFVRPCQLNLAVTFNLAAFRAVGGSLKTHIRCDLYVKYTFPHFFHSVYMSFCFISSQLPN